MHKYIFLSKDNALALLPFPETFLAEIDDALVAINNGDFGGKSNSIKELIKCNKKTKGKKSQQRFTPNNIVDLVVEYHYLWFEQPTDQHDYYVSYEAHTHGTPQSPMLRIHVQRCSGEKPNIQIGKSEHVDAHVESCRTISIPIQCVLKGWGNPEKGYMVYEHMLAPMDDSPDNFDPLCYIGLTSRGWLTRYSEHQRNALTGSNLIFHTSLSNAFDGAHISQRGMGPLEIIRSGLALYSELQYINLDYDEAMNQEERLVNRTLTPKGLNMIPGGFAGMKYLHKLGLLAKERVALEDRDEAITTYLINHPNKGQPAPWVAQKWENDEYYEQVILNRSNTLTREQVLDIRKYANEWHTSIDIIASLTGASIRQIRDVLSEKYYSRVQ
jgi:hypothetical protein